ncbi:MAG: helix-turn-helix domain-containing protein [Gammaproteobacteria bacterium]|nr:helix-turn-helix domain-containing protein [Gammaproteobacteria bacterium]MCW5582420.1 helix-turn-helix domain-containing protein [Gammaproteobacteria bacterium]
MEKIFTARKREKLIQHHRKERDKRICDRIKAVLAYDDGYSYSEIARILLLDDETIRRHIEDYQRE